MEFQLNAVHWFVIYLNDEQTYKTRHLQYMCYLYSSNEWRRALTHSFACFSTIFLIRAHTHTPRLSRTLALVLYAVLLYGILTYYSLWQLSIEYMCVYTKKKNRFFSSETFITVGKKFVFAAFMCVVRIDVFFLSLLMLFIFSLLCLLFPVVILLSLYVT